MNLKCRLHLPDSLDADSVSTEPKIKYHLPILSSPDFGLFRAPGPGLGNLLFPIARAVVGSETFGGRVVIPTMRQIKVGTYLRRERDKRTYDKIFRPRTRSEWIDWAYARNRKSQDEANHNASLSVIRYKGMGRQFHDLAGHADIVSKFLLSVSRCAPQTDQYDIAMHVRLGDFAAANVTEAKQNTRLTFEWYGEALEAAREHLGKKTPRGVLFTDEDPSLLIENLRLQNFAPEPPGNALTTLFAMSRAKILIAARSTFSLWGQYLGNSLAIWPNGFNLEQYKSVDPNYDLFV